MEHTIQTVEALHNAKRDNHPCTSMSAYLNTCRMFDYLIESSLYSIGSLSLAPGGPEVQPQFHQWTVLDANEYLHLRPHPRDVPIYLDKQILPASSNIATAGNARQPSFDLFHSLDAPFNGRI